MPHKSFIWCRGIKTELASLIEALGAPAPSCMHPKCRYIFKGGQHAASFPSLLSEVSHQYIRAPSHATSDCTSIQSPVSSCLVGDVCGLARTPGPSQDTFTPPSSNLALVGVSGRKGRAALHHKPHLHGCGFITSTISSTIPPSLPSASANRAVCDLLSSLPRPGTDKETTHLARESVSDGCDRLHYLLRLMEFV